MVVDELCIEDQGKIPQSLVNRKHCLLTISAALWISVQFPPNDTGISIKRVGLFHSIEIYCSIFHSIDLRPELPRSISVEKIK